jgi:hypothetical protein
MQLFDKFYDKKFLIPFLCAVLALYFYSLWGRLPDIDDAWLGEHAFWLEKLGYVRSELFRGMNGQETRFVVHHKFVTLHGAAFIGLFGFSLYSLKAVSIVYFFAFIGLFYAYTCRWKKIFTPEDFLFSTIILFSFTFAFKFSFIFRPEMMVMFLGFAGFILMEKYLDGGKNNSWLLFVSGLFFGLAVFAHLNSLVLIASAGILLLWNKKFTGVFIFGTGALLSSALYFYDFTGFDSIDLWIYQFFSSPSIDSLKDTPYYLKPIVNLLKEHMRYFHNLEIFVFSVFMFVTIIAGFKLLYKSQTNLVRFALLAAIFTGLLTMHKSRQYLLPFFPYILIMITLTFRAIKNKKIVTFPFLKRMGSDFFHGILIFLFIVFIGVSAFYNSKLAVQKFSPEDNRQLALKYAGSKVSEINIVAPLTFIFNEINYFHRIHSDLIYAEMSKIDTGFLGEGFFQKAANYNVSVIMVSKYVSTLLKIENSIPGQHYGEYVVVGKNPELIVFKRNENFSGTDKGN